MTHVGQYAHPPKRLGEQKSFGTIALQWCQMHWRVSVSIRSPLISEKRVVTSFDLRWPPRKPRSLVTPGSAQMWWVTMILKDFFVRFMRNWKHYHISPYAYNGEVTKSIWPLVTRIKTLIHAFYMYRSPQAIVLVSCWSYVNCSHNVIANVFEGGSADLTWWPGLTWPWT